MADHLDNLDEVDISNPRSGVHFLPLVQPSPDDSARLTVYLNGTEPRFEDHCTHVVTIRRTLLDSPVYLGIRPQTQRPLTSATMSGILALAGWKPGVKAQEDIPFIFLRGE